MMEEKLKKAAEALPEPRTTFSQIRTAAERKRNRRFRGWRAAAVLVCVLLIATISVAAVTEVHYSGWVNPVIFHGGVERRLDLTLPEEIGDSPCYEVREINVVPQGTSWLEALLFANYRYYDLDYGRQEQVRVYTSDEDGYGYTGYSEVRDPWHLTVGTTEKELWKHCFGIGEDGIMEAEDTLNGVHQTEYEGITLQYATDVFRYGDGTPDVYSHKVLWVDPENMAVFSLRRTGDSAEFPWELLEVAKGIIDENLE